MPRAWNSRDAAGQPTQLQARDDIEHPPARISQEAIKRGAAILGISDDPKFLF
jgi:hypothetical protein